RYKLTWTLVICRLVRLVRIVCGLVFRIIGRVRLFDLVLSVRGTIAVNRCDLRVVLFCVHFFFSSRRRHTRCYRDWSSDVCSSDLSPRKSPCVPKRVAYTVTFWGTRGSIPTPGAQTARYGGNTPCVAVEGAGGGGGGEIGRASGRKEGRAGGRRDEGRKMVVGRARR